ncbi:universal stress protein [Natrononativus amylolyticus]|uniref:universal stress protein n=1 Tax=Natrononativus amylolyticus TaxID=2963434 RepID=UPI0020CFD6D8|nr:universal stress protein [Natrononativus amylolyticus]
MTIVAAVDRSERTHDVVREAERLAEAFGDDLHVIHVLTRSEFVDLGQTSVESGESIDMKRVRAVAREFADEAVGDRTLAVPVETVGLMGDPASRIVEYADDTNARYLVVSPRRRSPAGKAVFGSVAQSVVLNAECPVVSTLAE